MLGICSVYISWAALMKVCCNNHTDDLRVVYSEIHPAMKRDTLIPGTTTILLHVVWIPSITDGRYEQSLRTMILPDYGRHFCHRLIAFHELGSSTTWLVVSLFVRQGANNTVDQTSQCSIS